MTGRWLGASAALGRAVPVDETYPHICGRPTNGTANNSNLLTHRDCAACAINRGPARPTAQPAQEDVVSDPALMLLAAYALAAEGLPVFFLGRTKRPVANCPNCPKGDPDHDPEACECLTCHGFYAASTDPDRIAAMRAAVPRGLLAIRTGGPIAVVDIDPRNGGRIVPELMPATRAVRTGSDGWHLYYAHPGGALGAKLHGYPGIDIKADGGYVVAPPSIHPGTGRPYRWIGDRPVAAMPPALADACRPTSEANTSRPFRVLLTGSRAWTDAAGITAVLDRLLRCHGPALTVVHGACVRGADAIAESWCRRNHVAVERYPADWSAGRRAGPARNAAMVATRPDLCIAFIRDASPGATGCADLAEQNGIPTLRGPRPLDLPDRPHATVTTLHGGRGISSPEALLEANLNAVRNAPRGQRRTRLYGAARGVARMVKAGAITHADAVNALTDVGREMGQPERDIRAAIIGGFRAESVATEGIAA
ncbi:hypothetical protein J2S43_006825 [Catenuloplanes nepalensis]|uniref:DNA primase/polymerase bifunctional N-terminal domain-containing protein n=1 Tax=Catenuloplanes nepalensis TaxID=587533 RepID=A0ABT9N3N1_9ACTN|nr:bifunctional DNA primase/polymerase [Catenuloplanes nepalensis]MDP9798313.1 hypothetical protein [Catenuloplanes nepalensis]